jgi:hypothetical protein
MALAIARHEFRGRRLMEAFLYVPIGTPEIVVGKDGSYHKDPASAVFTTASLNASNVTVLVGDLMHPGGKVELSDSMSLTTSGDFILDGNGVGAPFSNVAGITPPPKLRLSLATKSYPEEFQVRRQHFTS